MKHSVIAATVALTVVMGGFAPAAQAQTVATTTSVVAPGTAELLSQIKKLQSMLELYKSDSMKMRMKDDCKTATTTAATASSSNATSSMSNKCEKREEIKSKVEDKKNEIKSKVEYRKGSSSVATSSRDKNRGSMATSSKSGQRAAKEIAEAETEMADIKAAFGSSTEPRAIATLIRNGERKLAEAKSRFNEGKFTTAAVLARSAERSAKRADALYEKMQDDREDDN